MARHGLHFDQSRQTGVVFHMISCLTEHGRVGLTAVGDTPSEAGSCYREAERILLEEAGRALQERPLPVEPGAGQRRPVWYVAYGSNLRAGPVPVLPGRRAARRGLPRVRRLPRPHPPRRTSASSCRAGSSSPASPGSGAAGWRSTTGRRGEVAARAYLVTLEQFGDVVAQEARHPVGSNLTLERRGADGGRRLRASTRRWSTSANTTGCRCC